MIIVEFQPVFSLEPVDDSLAVDMMLDLLRLLFQVNLQAIILTLQEEYLMLKLLYILELGLQLFTAHLSHAFHVSFHSNEPLVVFLECLLCLLQVFDFTLVLLCDLGEVSLTGFICEAFPEHQARGADVILDGLLLHFA